MRKGHFYCKLRYCYFELQALLLTNFDTATANYSQITSRNATSTTDLRYCYYRLQHCYCILRQLCFKHRTDDRLATTPTSLWKQFHISPCCCRPLPPVHLCV